MNYCIMMILLNIVAIVFFYVRKKKVGIIIETTSLSRIRFYYLILGLFFILVLGFGNLYSCISIKGNLSDSDIYTISTLELAGVFFITMFFTSKIYVGLKGVSVPTLPYFISKDEITNYDFSSNTLILKRIRGKDYKIKIDIKDVKAIKSAVSTLK